MEATRVGFLGCCLVVIVALLGACDSAIEDPPMPYFGPNWGSTAGQGEPEAAERQALGRLSVMPREAAEPAPSRATEGQGSSARPEVASDEQPRQVAKGDEDRQRRGHSEAGVQAALTFVSPMPLWVSNPVTLSVTATGPIMRVEYWLDGTLMLGMSSSPASGFTALGSVWMAGVRVIEARGYGMDNGVLASTSMLFTVPEQSTGTDWLDPPPPSGSGGSDSAGDSQGGGDSEGGEASPEPSSTASLCALGEIVDCVGNCAKPEWLNDGFCDDGSQYAIDFTCTNLGMDGEDCGLSSQSPCSDGKLLDCVGNCAKAEWIGDGTCDDGSQYTIVLTCEALGMDGGDCDTEPEPEPAPSPAPTSSATGVPYFYQHANDLYPGSSCQNTSVAMLLASYGWSGTPDDITGAWGKDHAQSPAGLAEVFNHYAQAMGIPQRLTPRTNGSISGLKALLAQGKPTIIHGYFTGYGHVLVATGFNGSSYTVNDPAGQWSQSFKGGYPYGWSTTAGHGITYGAGAFEAAVATSDGYSSLPLWYHELTP